MTEPLSHKAVPNRQALTKTFVEQANAPSSGPGEFYWDTKVPGFGLRVYPPSERWPQGRRVYIYQYRTKARRQHRITIGTAEALTPDRAREIARDKYEIVRQGGDPMAEAKAATAGQQTVAAVVKEFEAKFLKQKKHAPSYVSGTMGLLNNHVVPSWGARDIGSITRLDVVELLDGIVAKPAAKKAAKGNRSRGGPLAANRTLAAIRKLFNWAMQRGIVDRNPATLIEKPASENVRERTLSDAEIVSLWRVLDRLPYPWGPYFKMLLVLAQRRAEVATMQWAEISESEGIWALPSEKTKSKRPHVVPLSKLALDILAEAREGAVALAREIAKRDGTTPKLGPYVFTTDGVTHIGGFGKAKAQIGDELAEADLTMPAWVIHDLRRTAATLLGRLGTPQFTIARVLNHADRSVTGQHYNLYEHLAEKRAALSALGQHIEALLREVKAKGERHAAQMSRIAACCAFP